MLAARRREEILARLERDGGVRVSDLVAALGVSDMTIRRDLGLLENDGLLAKVHGGAVALADDADDPTSTSEPGFEAKSVRQLAEKEAIARHAASLVRPGWAIAVSAGTTTYALARHLALVPRLTVVTNSVWVADVLHREAEPTQTVLLTGGQRTPSDALVGPVAITALRSMHLDAAFLGVHGMDGAAGFTTPNLLEAETNRAMVASSRRLVVLADSTKWGTVALSSMAPLGAARRLISDIGLPEQAREELAEIVEDVALVDPADLPRDWRQRMALPDTLGSAPRS